MKRIWKKGNYFSIDTIRALKRGVMPLRSVSSVTVAGIPSLRCTTPLSKALHVANQASSKAVVKMESQ